MRWDYSSRRLAEISGSRFPGLHNLPADLVVDGTEATKVCRYLGGDLTATTWPAETGETLVMAGAGADPAIAVGDPFYGPQDGSVDYDGTSEYHIAATNTLADITTEDLVVEVILEFSGGSRGAFAKGQNTSNFWRLVSGTSNLQFGIKDASANASTNTASGLTDGQRYHFMAYVNRDENSANGGFCLLDGAPSGSGGNFSAVSGTLTNTLKMTLGFMPQNFAWNHKIYSAALWKGADLIPAGSTGKDAIAAIAAERFHLLTAGTGSMYAI